MSNNAKKERGQEIENSGLEKSNSENFGAKMTSTYCHKPSLGTLRDAMRARSRSRRRPRRRLPAAMPSAVGVAVDCDGSAASSGGGGGAGNGDVAAGRKLPGGRRGGALSTDAGR